DAAAVQAGAAQPLVPFDDGRLQAQLRRPDRRHVPRRPGADDHHVEHVSHTRLLTVAAPMPFDAALTLPLRAKQGCWRAVARRRSTGYQTSRALSAPDDPPDVPRAGGL